MSNSGSIEAGSGFTLVPVVPRKAEAEVSRIDGRANPLMD